MSLEVVLPPEHNIWTRTIRIRTSPCLALSLTRLMNSIFVALKIGIEVKSSITAVDRTSESFDVLAVNMLVLQAQCIEWKATMRTHK